MNGELGQVRGVSTGEEHLKTATLGEGGLAEPVGTGNTCNNG